MIAKAGFLVGVGIVASLAALFWVEPETRGGQGLLALVVFSLVNGLGAFALWIKSWTASS
jgi:hypothetical protein